VTFLESVEFSLGAVGFYGGGIVRPVPPVPA
jgi:hypothetical protein